MATYITFQPTDYFSPLIYTGTGSAHAITGVGFQPDLVFTKERGSENWGCIDAVRGVTEALYPNLTTAETTDAQSITAFGSDGFSVGTSTTWNTSGAMACWNWKAGTTTGIDTTGSTITPSSYSFNATSSFSVIAYTGNGSAGALVPHGLGVAPKMIIVKKRGGTDLWGVYHVGTDATAPEDYHLVLNSTSARIDSTTMWNDTAPTSVLFSLGSGGDVNNSGTTFIAYCFAEKKGYSKFSSFIGNGNVDGPFVYTGFRPACVMLKQSSGAGESWSIFDNKRNPHNFVNKRLMPNSTAAESDYPDASNGTFDFCSNGLKLRASNAAMNASGATYIYAAFAEFPLVSSNDIPTVAR